MSLGVVGVGGWRVFVCVWGLCLGVVGLGASLVCVCVCVCVGWACGLGMCVGWLDVCVRGLGVLVGVCVGGLGVWVGHVCWWVGRVCSWVGRVGWGVVGCWWVGRVCSWVGRVGRDVVGCWWVDAQNMINTVSHLIETKNQQRFWTLFLKNFYKFLSSYWTKIRFPIKSFLTTFITHKTCFTTICIDSNQKTQKKNFDPIFQKFLQVFVLPIGQKFQFLKKFFPTTFFTQKTCFTHFYIDLSRKNAKKLFDPIFQKFLQVLISYMAKISKFEKIFSDNFFLLKKHVSHIFTLIKAEKTQKKKIFDPILQKFLQVLISYRAKTSKFEKIFSDNFFYSKNMFHIFLH